jgi:hypothetical protein
VQSVAANAVVVRELDGSALTVPVSSSTRVFVDGRRASVADVEPGFVASASWAEGKAAAELQVFDASASVTVVKSVSARAVEVEDAAGTTATIRVTPKTRVFVDGAPAQLRTVAAGYTLVVEGRQPPRKPPTELRFLRPG